MILKTITHPGNATNPLSVKGNMLKYDSCEAA